MEPGNSRPLQKSCSDHNEAPASLTRWLLSSPLLDLDDPRLRITALKLTQVMRDDRSKAVAIHNFLQRMPFGCVPNFQSMRARQVLEARMGDCHTKGTLFVALARAAGVPARLRFLTLKTEFMRGILANGADQTIHAVAEVWLQGRWVQTSTHVVDPVLCVIARARLDAEGRSVGYGIHRNGKLVWNGTRSVYSQFDPEDPQSAPLYDWGVYDDPLAFYSAVPEVKHRLKWVTRMKWTLAAGAVNRQVQHLREHQTVRRGPFTPPDCFDG